LTIRFQAGGDYDPSLITETERSNILTPLTKTPNCLKMLLSRRMWVSRRVLHTFLSLFSANEAVSQGERITQLHHILLDDCLISRGSEGGSSRT
jgi:hypothetical protein